MQATVHVWRSKDNLWKSVFAYDNMDHRDWTQVLGFLCYLAKLLLWAANYFNYDMRSPVCILGSHLAKEATVWKYFTGQSLQ